MLLKQAIKAIETEDQHGEARDGAILVFSANLGVYARDAQLEERIEDGEVRGIAREEGIDAGGVEDG